MTRMLTSYGVGDFKKLREENRIYVDKTKYIEILERQGEPHIFFLRPRRFGKSLFLSTLYYYYDINSKDNFGELFNDLYIYKKPTESRNTYYVLKFNFSQMNTTTKEECLEGFRKNVLDGLEAFEAYYNLNLEYDREGMPSEIFMTFLTEISQKLRDKKVYVLIDEYDHFANELLSKQVEVFEEVVSKTGFVRKWYEALKKGTEVGGIVYRIFGTGVAPVTLDSLTSGANMISNETRTATLNAMAGFTEDEVIYVCKTLCSDDTDINELMPDLKKYYNGYMFSEDAKEKIFNSDMILYYFKEYVKLNKPPVKLIDSNISSDYHKLYGLFTLKNKEGNLEILKEIVSGEEHRAQITDEFSLARPFNKYDFLSLLFYLGFLTIKTPSGTLRVDMKIPNYVIKELYFSFFESVLSKAIEYKIDIYDIEDSIEKISYDGKIDGLVKIVEGALSKLSNRDFMNLDEKHIKILMITYMMLPKVYYVKSEYEVEKGYIDIALFNINKALDNYDAIIEVKHITKKTYKIEGEKAVETKKKEAREQIEKYKTAEELVKKKKLKKWIIVFVGDKCEYIEEIEA